MTRRTYDALGYGITGGLSFGGLLILAWDMLYGIIR